MRNRMIGIAAALGLVTATPVWTLELSSQAQLIEAVRFGGARPENAVRVEQIRLKAGPAEIHLGNGILVPAAPVGGRAVEFVFRGEGRIRLEPPDELERGQLELFTGSSILDLRFGTAVFVIALDAATDLLAGFPSAAGDDQVEPATGMLEQWRQSPERRLLEVDARVLMDVAGDPLAKSFFCGYFGDTDLGDFLYVVDPLSNEQVTLGQFVQAELNDRQRRKAERHLAREQGRGKLIGLELADLGIWDTWISTSLRTAEGEIAPGTTGVEPEHYSLEAVLRGKQLRLDATARIDLKATVEGLRTVNLDCSAALEVQRVMDAGGRDLGYLRSHGELTVLLPGPVASGEVFSIELQYSGEPFQALSSGAFIQRDTLGWYPHAGNIDRATYDVTIRWPKKYDLYGSGSVVQGGVGADGLRWQRRKLDVRSLGFSFEIGDYRELTDQVGHVQLTVAIDRIGRKADRGLAGEVLESVRESLAYFEGVFGPYPLDELTVVSSPRGFSQGLLGFVTLSTAGIMDWDMWGKLLGFEDRRTLIAHEIAHQWWGNTVGWSGYRDLWISEAMANYSALLYERNRLRRQNDEQPIHGPTSGWKSELMQLTYDGRQIESLGPVVLGTRLNSSLSTRAVRSIVYKKGAVVLDMLARYHGEGAFLEILKEIVRVASGKVLSTDRFLLMVERLGGTDLSWFSRQYVHGTGLPEIYYDYRIERGEEGGWVVEGEARQQAPYGYGYRVIARPDGELDVLRESTIRLDVEDSVLVVPFQIGVARPKGTTGSQARVSAPQRREFLVGTVVLAGELSPFRFELNEQPEIMWLDRDEEVFGRFFCGRRWPKRIAYFNGLDAAAAGDLDEAEAMLLAALEAAVADIPESWQELEGDLDREAAIVDARIHLALARLYLDTDRLTEAASELAAVATRLPREERWRAEAQRVLVEARLALREGDADRAYDMLRKGLLGRRGFESIEGYALLSVAAHRIGQREVYQQVCGRALERGADLGPLVCE